MKSTLEKIYVKQRWAKPYAYYEHGSWCVMEFSVGAALTLLANKQKSQRLAWSAAYAFTLEREEQIRQVEEEICMLCGKILLADKDMAAMDRILVRERAALAELKRGMKEATQ